VAKERARELGRAPNPPYRHPARQAPVETPTGTRHASRILTTIVDDMSVQPFASFGVARVQVDRAGTRGDAGGDVQRQLLDRHGQRGVFGLRSIAVEGRLQHYPGDSTRLVCERHQHLESLQVPEQRFLQGESPRGHSTKAPRPRGTPAGCAAYLESWPLNAPLGNSALWTLT
jgi:hypothetical protein